mgnify:CR=1 FL=1
MIRSRFSSPSLAIGAPRVCGDDPVSYAEVPYHIMCSPRMRG